MYNIIRISCKNSSVGQVDDSKENSVSSKENEPENISKCPTGLLVTIEDRPPSSDHVDQLEVEYTVPDGQAKVLLYSNIISLCKLFCIA